MRVVVTGSHGLIGGALVRSLSGDGHQVTRLVRGEPAAGEARWDPPGGTVDASALEGADAVVHLAGVGIGDHRWTRAHKRAVLDSRVVGTRALATAIARVEPKPKVFASASAVGFYGDRGDEVCTEGSSGGDGFLAHVVQEWEATTRSARDAGVRVACLRSGVVLSARGGALRAQLLPFKLGLGGRLGSGRQWLSWITIDDEVAGIRRVLDDDRLAGPINVTSPNPVTNAEFTKTLGRVLRRPTALPIPTIALRLRFGSEMTAEMLLAGQRVMPTVLEGNGFAFAHPRLEEGLRHVLSMPAQGRG